MRLGNPRALISTVYINNNYHFGLPRSYRTLQFTLGTYFIEGGYKWRWISVILLWATNKNTPGRQHYKYPKIRTYCNGEQYR